MLSSILDGVFSGLSIGSILLLAALGLAIVFGLMGVINMAHGELMMLGAYTTYVVQNVFKPIGGPLFEGYIFFALIAAFLVAALAGLALERGVIRYLYGRPLETLLATWGVSLILQQFVRSVNWVLVIGLLTFCLLFFGGKWLLRRQSNIQRIGQWASATLLPLAIALSLAVGAFLSQTYKLKVTEPWFGANNKDVTAPGWLRGGFSIADGAYQLPYVRVFILILTIFCVVGVYLFLQKSPWGLRIRAVTQNRNMSACLGISTRRVDAITFAIGSGLAGVAGCAVSMLGSVGPNTGQNYIVNTFMVVVVGGVGNLFGSILGAMAIGITEYVLGTGILSLTTKFQPLVDFFTFFATTSMAKVMVFALIVTFLQFRPGGLFPQKGRTVDA